MPHLPGIRRSDALLVFAAALGLRLAFAALTAGSYDPDEFVILSLGNHFAHGAIPYRNFTFFHPPGILVLFRLLQPLTSLWWPAGRLLMLLVDSLTAMIVWRIGRVLYGPRTALAAGLLYAASPIALLGSVRIGQDPIITALGAAGLLALLAVRRWPGAVLAGICLGLAVWFKYPAVLFVPVYLIAAPRRALAALGVAAATLIIALAPFAGQLGSLLSDSVGWQSHRAASGLAQRLGAVGAFWLLLNPLGGLAVLYGVGTWRSGPFRSPDPDRQGVDVGTRPQPRSDAGLPPRPFRRSNADSRLHGDSRHYAASQPHCGAVPETELGATENVWDSGLRNHVAPRTANNEQRTTTPRGYPEQRTTNNDYAILAGFLAGIVFLASAQVYYHYFMIVVPFAALLGAPLLAGRRTGRLAAGAMVILVTMWSVATSLGPVQSGLGQLSLADATATARLIEQRTAPRAAILTDQFEYAYFSGRTPLLDYFWDMQDTVSARTLERRLPEVQAVVATGNGRQSYPPAFLAYLQRRRFPAIHEHGTTVWLVGRKS